MGLSGVFLQSFSIVDLFVQWEQFGVFDLILPFLLIFSVVFGVLTATNILGGNRGINLIIALVIALMALRLQFVSVFFTELFPRFAIGLAALVVAVILIGLFIPKEHAQGWFIGFGVVGALIAIISVLQTFNQLDFFGSYFWQEWATIIISAILVIAVIITIVALGGNKDGGKSGKSGEITLPIGAFRS